MGDTTPNGCWGPGNYSCNRFLQIIDPNNPLETKMLMIEDEGYKRFDDFTYFENVDFTDTAMSTHMSYSGWYKLNEVPEKTPSQLFTIATEGCDPYSADPTNQALCQVPSLRYGSYGG